MRVTVGYAVLLVAVATVLLLLGPRVQDMVVAQMSTNLHNLMRGHIGTLIGSAFVAVDGPIYVWLPGLFCLLAVTELLWHGGVLVVTFAFGHIGATLIVAAGLAAAIQFGWTPVSVARASDVGISYGAVAVLGALTAAIPARWRPAWIGWWLAVTVLAVSAVALGVAPARGGDFTDAGHIIAMVLGMALSTRFRSGARWTPLRVVLLVIGGSFGYLVLINTALLLLIAPLVGLLGACAAHWAVRRRQSRRGPGPVAIAVLPAPQPVPGG